MPGSPPKRLQCSTIFEHICRRNVVLETQVLELLLLGDYEGDCTVLKEKLSHKFQLVLQAIAEHESERKKPRKPGWASSVWLSQENWFGLATHEATPRDAGRTQETCAKQREAAGLGGRGGLDDAIGEAADVVDADVLIDIDRRKRTESRS